MYSFLSCRLSINSRSIACGFCCMINGRRSQWFDSDAVSVSVIRAARPARAVATRLREMDTSSGKKPDIKKKLVVVGDGKYVRSGCGATLVFIRS